MYVPFRNNVMIKVGKGDRTLFWQDAWCSSSPLKLTFARIYSISGLKEGTVQQYYNMEGSSTSLSMHLRIHLNDWEVGEEGEGELMQILKNVTLMVREEYRRVWAGKPCGKFSVSAFFKKLNLNGIYPCPATFLWKLKVPSKVAFFMWILFHGKSATQD